MPKAKITRSKKHLINFRVGDLVKRRLDEFSKNNEIPVTNIATTALMMLLSLGLEKIRKDYYMEPALILWADELKEKAKPKGRKKC